MSTKPTAPAPSSSKEIDDIGKLLDREAQAFQRELEVTRILKAFKLNPYEILDLDPSVDVDAVKKKYRQLSLFIHPDKTPDPRAPDAFDLLKKAEAELGDEKKREALHAILKEARSSVLKTLHLPVSIEDKDPRLQHLDGPSFKDRVKAGVKELMIEEEVRRRTAIKVNLANEGTEQRMKEAEVAMKKRKAEEDARWEETREARVGSWRNFSGKPKKKKKTESLLG